MERFIAPIVHVLVHKVILLILHGIIDLVVAVDREGMTATGDPVLQLGITIVIDWVHDFMTLTEAFMATLQLRTTSAAHSRAPLPIDRLGLPDFISPTRQNRIDCLTASIFLRDLFSWHGPVARVWELYFLSRDSFRDK